MNEDVLSWKEDGLKCLDVGPWVLEKYRPLYDYMEMFATGMKGRWEKRVYIDLYSGPGVVRMRSTGKLLRGSPLLSLTIKDKFDKYIFCEEENESYEALEKRVSTCFGGIDVTPILGNCNQRVADVISAIPKYSQKQKVLSFCFVDPFSLELEFETIRRLASRFVDFLVLLALDMDARRNVKHYLKEENKKIDKFLGDDGWRSKWEKYAKKDDSFQRFLAREFEAQMIGLDYKKALIGNTVQVRTNDKNLPLYHLAFFSRHERGYQFWGEVRKLGANPSLFDN